MSGIVMRPVQDRRSAAIVNHLAANFDAIARRNGHAWRDVDVVDDLHRPSRGRERELFVFASRVRTEEEAWLSHNGPGKIGHARHLLRSPITRADEENKRRCK